VQVLVVPLRVNVNLKAITVEEKEAQRQVSRPPSCGSCPCVRDREVFWRERRERSAAKHNVQAGCAAGAKLVLG
jgi:hypothetical protein